MKKYYNFSPRGFANEFTTLYVESAEQEEKLLNWYEEIRDQDTDLQRVTVRELRELAQIERERLRVDPDFGFNCNPDEPISFVEFSQRFGIDL